jgi:hypothetical protein
MADHPHSGDTLHDGLGICLAFTGDLLCADRRHCRRIHRRGTGNGLGGAGGSVGDDGRVIVLMLIGVALSAMIWRLQAYLLRWQHNIVD